MFDYRQFIGARAEFRSRRWGMLTVESAALTDAVDGDLVVYFGDPLHCTNPLVRIHSECVFGEAFDSDLCECASQLHMAMDRLQAEGDGLLFYLRIDGRGTGLSAKVAATELEVRGVDTYDSRVNIGVPPERRDFSNIGAFLRDKGFTSVRLLTNNPLKIGGLALANISVTPVPLIALDASPNIRRLLRTKAERFAHRIPEIAFRPDQLPLAFLTEEESA